MKLAQASRGYRGRTCFHIKASSIQTNQKPKKHVVVTGGNTGIGFEAAKALASKGYAATLACRNMEKAKAAQERIISQVPGADVDILELKLDNLNSVKDAAAKLADQDKLIDVLLNNAGVMACPEMKTDDGYEYQVGVNHLGHFLFTNQLLPKLLANNNGCRIVNVSSSAHLFGGLQLDDLMFTKRAYNPWTAYGQSKLANILFTYQLARMLSNRPRTTVNCLHPGVVGTELARYLLPDNLPFSGAIQQVTKAFLKTPEQGAQTSIYLASSSEVEGITSKYYVDCVAQSSSFESYNTGTAQKLWELSQELTKCDVPMQLSV